MEEEGLINKQKDPDHKQRIKYTLTEKGIDLLPILLENARWSLKYKPVNEDDAKIAQSILNGGTEAVQQLMSNLKEIHLK